MTGSTRRTASRPSLTSHHELAESRAVSDESIECRPMSRNAYRKQSNVYVYRWIGVATPVTACCSVVVAARVVIDQIRGMCPLLQGVDRSLRVSESAEYKVQQISIVSNYSGTHLALGY